MSSGLAENSVDRDRDYDRNRVRIYVPVLCGLVVAIFAAVLIIPQSRAVFELITAARPMAAGFVKFAFLATIGETIAIRISNKEWAFPDSLPARMLIWGILGALIALMMKLFAGGVSVLMADSSIGGFFGRLLCAFLTSVLMNATFAPVMMGTHKMSDTYLGLRREGRQPISRHMIVERIDWDSFIGFVLLKSIPFFWIPAHTLTFLLPPEFRTIVAAFLSIVLGVILSLSSKKH